MFARHCFDRFACPATDGNQSVTTSVNPVGRVAFRRLFRYLVSLFWELSHPPVFNLSPVFGASGSWLQAQCSTISAPITTMKSAPRWNGYWRIGSSWPPQRNLDSHAPRNPWAGYCVLW